MAKEITNAVILERINNLKEYLVERNNIQDKKIHLQEEKTERNTVAIAGMKGASGVIAVLVTAIMNAFILFFFKVQK